MPGNGYAQEGTTTTLRW